MADNTVNKDSTKKKTSQHCCVPLCTSDSRYNPSLHFHHIPSKDKDVRKQWIINIRRDEGPQFKVCYIHVYMYVLSFKNYIFQFCRSFRSSCKLLF